MKLELQVNSRAINDTSRSLEGTGILITPPLDESFWLFRVAVSDNQAVVGFPKFGVIGIGFQVEKDWNTNLPSGTSAFEIYDHIKHNKGAGIPKDRCLVAIMMIQNAVLDVKRREFIDKLRNASGSTLVVVGQFLRQTGSHSVAEAFGQ